jgi:hypothetical protein
LTHFLIGRERKEKGEKKSYCHLTTTKRLTCVAELDAPSCDLSVETTVSLFMPGGAAGAIKFLYFFIQFIKRSKCPWPYMILTKKTSQKTKKPLDLSYRFFLLLRVA